MRPWAAREYDPHHGSRIGDQAGGESLIGVLGSAPLSQKAGLALSGLSSLRPGSGIQFGE